MLPTSTAMRRRRAVGVTVALLLAACGGEQGPTQPAPLAFAAVSTGFEHTCGLAAAGALYCWGANSFGKLGDGTMSDRSSPVRVMGGVNFAAVSAGGHHTCAVTGAGTAYCWGFNRKSTRLNSSHTVISYAVFCLKKKKKKKERSSI